MRNRLFTATAHALSSAAIAALALGSVTGAALAQAAPKAADAPKGLAANPEWFKVCSPQGDNNICNTQFAVIADTRQLITAVNLIDVKGKVNQRVFQAVVPTGRVIPAGVQMQIDDKAAQTINFSVCFPDRCIAEAQLTDAMVAAMKKGKVMTVASVNFQRQPNPVKITLNGFSKAFDGPPAAQPELAKRQDELNDALKKQAEERRKKFEDAQAAAKSGDAAPVN